jgi:putative tryptophan/tyrosine transport system substrate-binding protein
MKRRAILKLIGVGTAVWPLAARAQPPARVRLVGVLIGWSDGDPATQSLVTAFRETLAKLGWTEGRNLRLEVRWGNGDAARIGAFAKELISLRPDVIFGQTTPVISALSRNASDIPVIFVQVSDPIGSGFAESLARPTRNMTGFTTDNSTLGGKWVDLLKEIAPHTTRMAVLFNPETAPPSKFFMPSVQAAASSVDVEARIAPVRTKDGIERVIAEQARQPGGGIIVTPDPFNVANRDLIVAQVARYQVPTIYFNRSFADSGGLIVYGDVFAEQFREAAEYVNRVLKGANPADLPIQAPTKFELIVNLKTAKALGLAVPATLLARADEVIE